MVGDGPPRGGMGEEVLVAFCADKRWGRGNDVAAQLAEVNVGGVDVGLADCAVEEGAALALRVRIARLNVGLGGGGREGGALGP